MLLPHLKDLSTRVRGLGLMGNIGALLMHITAPLGFLLYLSIKPSKPYVIVQAPMLLTSV